jgi:hypothetical protein
MPGLNPYMTFIKKERPQFVKEHPEMKATAVISALAKKWRELDSEQKSYYIKISKPSNTEHSAYFKFIERNRESISASSPKASAIKVSELLHKKWNSLTEKEKSAYA